MVKKKPAAPSAGTASDYLTRLMALGLRLIPLDVGSKATHEPNWQRRGESALAPLIARSAAHWEAPPAEVEALLGVPLPAWIAEQVPYGWGNLNAAAGTVVLDMDHADALTSLQAGVQALGGPPGYVPTGSLAWDAPRGRKWIWRAFTGCEGRSCRLVTRTRTAAGIHVEAVLELRGSGQDMLPHGWRADRGTALRWSTPDGMLDPAATLEPCPEWVGLVMQALMRGDAAVLHAMQAAAGTPADLIGLDATHAEDYPGRLAGRTHERKIVNAAHTVADLLTAGGYEKAGGRWRKPNSHHAAGIVPPGGNRRFWHCWNEGDVLSGQFDAWRVFVEVTHSGDLAKAIESARSIARPLRAVPRQPAPATPSTPESTPEVPSDGVSAPVMRTVLTEISHSEKSEGNSQIPPDEMPAKGPRRPAKGPATLEASTGSPTPRRGATRPKHLGGVQSPPEPAEGGQATSTPEIPTVAGKGPSGASVTPSDSVEQGDMLDLDALLVAATRPVRLALDGQLRVPVGSYLLTGAPKAGKSWLAMGMSLAMSGRLDSVLGMAAVAPGDGLYVLVDDATEERVRSRVVGMLADGHARAGHKWHAAVTWPPREYEGMGRIEALGAYLTDRPGVRHVVIDTLVAWRASERSQSVVQQEYDEARALQEVARRHGIVLLIVHYTNKGGSARNFDWDDPFTSIAGTTALQGGADGMFVIHRVATDSGDQNAGIWFTSRDLEAQEAAGRLAAPSGRWEWLAASAEAVRTLDQRSAVLEWLTAQPAGDYHASAAILDAVAGVLDAVPKKDSFLRTLSRMAREGLLDSQRGAKGGGFRLSMLKRAEHASRKF